MGRTRPEFEYIQDSTDVVKYGSAFRHKISFSFLRAEQLGKSYNMVNAYAQNRRQPSLEDLYKIAEILDVDVATLLNERKSQ